MINPPAYLPRFPYRKGNNTPTGRRENRRPAANQHLKHSIRYYQEEGLCVIFYQPYQLS